MREEAKEKKSLRLKVKTLSDAKRWFSKGLHNIIEKFRTKNRDGSDKTLAELARDGKYTEIFKFAVREKLVTIADKQSISKQYRIEDEYDIKKENLEIEHENGQISDRKYRKELENIEYAKQKHLYANDLPGSLEERPANPRLQRIGRTVKNIVLAPIRAAKYVGRKVQSFVRGSKVALLTTGKVVQKSAVAVKNTVKNQIDPVAQQVKEAENAKIEMKTAEKSKELDETATLAKKKEIFDNSSKAVQNQIFDRDYKLAMKEDAKREREAQRRKNLHMDEEAIPVNHEKAASVQDKEDTKKIERVDGEVLTKEEVAAIYGEDRE
ncbi:MAG: hypothetical protein ACLU84_08725 [Clostridia bacterium]